MNKMCKDKKKYKPKWKTLQVYDIKYIYKQKPI